jgi:hypothetical protein
MCDLCQSEHAQDIADANDDEVSWIFLHKRLNEKMSRSV